jgi:hypothetical protein
MPATIMRPKAPTAGKRIPLEYIKPLWSRLSFSYKVTARNLFRYGKRVCMTLFGMPYELLISVFIAIMALIPVLGAWIGCIVGAFLILVVNPGQALGFAFLILIIQQLDGNVIGPKILGDSIGISALWVLFSIVVFGDLFGLVGMVIGVPVFATLLGLVKEFAEWCLRYRGIDKEGRPLNADGTALPPSEPEEPEVPHVPMTEKVKQTVQQKIRNKQNHRSQQ